LTFGYHNPAALIIVLKYLLLALNSVSMSRTEPHSAKLLKPSEAICPSPQKLKFFSCEAPMTSEKWVNHRENGKFFFFFEEMHTFIATLAIRDNNNSLE
jgi:hypothetical protein